MARHTAADNAPESLQLASAALDLALLNWRCINAIHQHYTEAQAWRVKNMPEDFFTCKIVVDAPNVYGAVRTTSWGVDIHGPNLVQPHGATNWILDYVGPYKP